MDYFTVDKCIYQKLSRIVKKVLFAHI